MRDPFPGYVNLGDGSQFVDEFANVIDRTRLFEDFEYAEVHKLAAKMPCYRAPAGALLIGEGDEGDFGLVLLKGRAGVFKRDASGHDVRIGEVGPGDTLGEMSMIDGQPRVASCLASEEVRIRGAGPGGTHRHHCRRSAPGRESADRTGPAPVRANCASRPAGWRSCCRYRGPLAAVPALMRLPGRIERDGRDRRHAGARKSPGLSTGALFPWKGALADQAAFLPFGAAAEPTALTVASVAATTFASAMSATCLAALFMLS